MQVRSPRLDGSATYGPSFLGSSTISGSRSALYRHPEVVEAAGTTEPPAETAAAVVAETPPEPASDGPPSTALSLLPGSLVRIDAASGEILAKSRSRSPSSWPRTAVRSGCSVTRARERAGAGQGGHERSHPSLQRRYGRWCCWSGAHRAASEPACRGRSKRVARRPLGTGLSLCCGREHRGTDRVQRLRRRARGPVMRLSFGGEGPTPLRDENSGYDCAALARRLPVPAPWFASA